MCSASEHGVANFSSADTGCSGIGFGFTGGSVEGNPLGPSIGRMKQICNAPQPDDPRHHCVRFHDHTGPHQTFVAEWKDGDSNSRRRPALHFRNGRPAGNGNRLPSKPQFPRRIPQFMRANS